MCVAGMLKALRAYIFNIIEPSAITSSSRRHCDVMTFVEAASNNALSALIIPRVYQPLWPIDHYMPSNIQYT